MDTANEVKFNVIKVITDIAYKLQNSKLSASVRKATRLKNEKLADYLCVTPQQSYMFAVIFILQSTERDVVIHDITSYLDMTFLDVPNLNKEIQSLCNANLIDSSENHASIRRKSRVLTSYTINNDVLGVLIANKPISHAMPELLDVYDFFEEVSELISERDNAKMNTKELMRRILSIETINEQLDVVEKTKSLKIPLEERALLYEMCNDLVVHRKPTSVLKTLSDIYDRPRERLRKLMEFTNKTNILFQQELITSSEARFMNDQNIELTNNAIELLLGDDAILVTQKIKNRNIIYSTDIKEKELFFEGKLKKEIEFLSKTLQHEQYKEMTLRLEEQGLRPSINALLYGHPGTGKTEICYQLSKQTGRDIIAVDLSQVRNLYFGESEKRVKEIFVNYRRIANRSDITPILLINEADGLLSKRKENNLRNTDQTENLIQNILLEEIEQFKGILLCTSNLVQNLDNAFERRFLFKVKFDAPSVNTKKLIWKNKLPWLADDLVEELSTKFPFSGGQIDNIAKKVAIHKVLNNVNPEREEIIDFCSSETLQLRASKIGYN